MPTAPQFNQQFRDNFNELAQHNHAGASGSGAATLGGAAGLEYISFREGSAPGTPGGTLNAFYASNGTFGWVNANGTAFLAANSTHEHTGSWIQPTQGSFEDGTVDAQGITVYINGPSASNGTFLEGGTATFTVGGTGSRAWQAEAFFLVAGQTVAQRNIQLRARVTLNGTGATNLNQNANFIQAAITSTHSHHFHIVGTFTAQASGSYRITTEIGATASTGNQPFLAYGTVSVAEFQIK